MILQLMVIFLFFCSFAEGAVTFVVSGALAANATTTTLNIVAPTLNVDDIMIASILNKDNQVVTAPANWTKFVQVNNTTAQRLTLAWKRAIAGDSGATFSFTKPTDNNTLFCGNISVWRGAITSGDPTTGAGTPTTSANASSDTVSYASFDPLIACHAVAVGVYNDDLTTAGTISGSDPSLVNRWDLETATGSDGSVFGYGGDSTGAATGARSHITTSTADGVNIGCLFGLEAAPASTTAVKDPIMDGVIPRAR